jgi:hypothetical protein
MPKGDVETFYDSANNSWSNQVQGEGSTDELFETKDRAVSAGRALAKEHGREHIIKNQDGTIAERSAYGNDPRDVPR